MYNLLKSDSRDYIFRYATINDVIGVKQVILESIKNCFDDHHGEEEIIENWCKNKTNENILKWILDDQNICVTVENINHEIVGFALFNLKQQMLLLCYVKPAYQAKGIGKELLNLIESLARDKGIFHLKLNSSKTALKFYLNLGYILGKEHYNDNTKRYSYSMYKNLALSKVCKI